MFFPSHVPHAHRIELFASIALAAAVSPAQAFSSAGLLSPGHDVSDGQIILGLSPGYSRTLVK